MVPIRSLRSPDAAVGGAVEPGVSWQHKIRSSVDESSDFKKEFWFCAVIKS